MKQILQNIGNGDTTIENVPCPSLDAGSLLIATSHSVLSVGTEKMLMEFGQANLLQKVLQQPDKVKMVIEKVRTDGLLPTLDAVRDKLDQPLALGYSNVGIIIEVGNEVEGFQIGDRVASNGHHAEVVCVPKNLCALVPKNVTDENAAFAVVAAIALQGIRLVQPTIGETVVVIGLGLVGLAAVQLLIAQGCRVMGVDLDSDRVDRARHFGAVGVDLSAHEDVLLCAHEMSRGYGIDAVLITATTKSSDPVSQAAKMCRKRGRIVLVGVTGLNLSRADFYEKELSFQVSCSYGPGRYDANYEEKGHDYPIGFVRWTEKRNIEATLDLMSAGAINLAALITDRFEFKNAVDAYDLIRRGGAPLGVLLEYPLEGSAHTKLQESKVLITSRQKDEIHRAENNTCEVVVGVIGAGSYAGRVLIPTLSKLGVELDTIVSKNGVSATHIGKKFKFSQASRDVDSLLADEKINAVVIATRHNTHADYVIKSLKAGKHVFVEKPLSLTTESLQEVKDQYEISQGGDLKPILLVGFNRRFAPHVIRIKQLLANMDAPKNFVMTVNAGEISASSWVQDINIGGGRIVGEVCHFIDLLRHLAGCKIVNHSTNALRKNSSPSDNLSISLRFSDGSTGVVHYLTNGHKGFPKERLEVFCSGRIIQLDNFRKMRGYGWPEFRKLNLFRQDKGNAGCMNAFVRAIRTQDAAPISFDELIEVSRITIEVANTC